ncbi:histidine-specific methyltransferase [Trichoderma evansii]
MSQTTLVETASSQVLHLHRIRQFGLLDLKECLISGLQDSPKTMPSLLLWDDQGLKNFDTWTKAPSYYPKRCEWEILTRYGYDIAQHFQAKNLSKTAFLLQAAEKERRHVYYYALDVSEEALHKNLSALKQQFAKSRFINIEGLSGTYDDCTEWLGRSAILPASTASSLMSQFHQACRKMSVDCRFLVSADCCNVERDILEAYDANKGPSRTFLFHSLHHANQLLGENVFREEEWNAVPEWDEVQHELRYSYTPKTDLHIKVGDSEISLTKGESIHFFMSGKWQESQMTHCQGGGDDGRQDLERCPATILLLSAARYYKYLGLYLAY